MEAVRCNHAAVAYEVILGLKCLVNKQGPELQDPAWSILLEIISHVLCHIDLTSSQSPNRLIVAPLHDTLNFIEHLMKVDSYNGSVKQFYGIIEECSADRPESSILGLIVHHAQSIVPTEHLWLTNLYNLLQKYFKLEIRKNIRLKVLETLSHVIKLNRRQYEDELIDRIVVPHMVNMNYNNDIVVRSSVANLLIDLCLECESKKCLDLLDILEKMLLRPFDTYLSDNSSHSDAEFSDIKCLVEGLIKVFIVKIHKLPSTHAIKIYKMLVKFLELHYNKPKLFENCPIVRKMIFECFLKIRADPLYHLGYQDGKNLKFSSYICVVYKSTDRGSLGSPVPQSPAPHQRLPVTVTPVSLRAAFKIFITCLKVEKDWEVLSLVIIEMTKALQNKALLVSKNGNTELDLLVDVLTSMITEKIYNLPESLNVKVSRPDFHATVLLAVVNLASYHNYLDQIHQQKIVRCLIKCSNSIGPRSSKHCIAALTLCTLEMRETMVKCLPEVLLNLSKISATVHIGIPILEFLSNTIPPYETHKIGVLYVREGQIHSEVEIYKNRFGSLRYVQFLQQLGTLVKLSDVDPQTFFLGGLDQHGNDGKFAYIWQDDVTRVMFHVATMMPNKESDPTCNNKKMHIGNNFVTIIYNESGEEVNMSTFKPLDMGINRVTVKVKEELANLIASSEPKLVSDQNVGIFARQIALHTNMASIVTKSLKHPNEPAASNWIERLRQIKKIRNRAIQDQKNNESIYQNEKSNEEVKNKYMEDFTDYT
ncbi:unnamed protein product [Diabrotica balteata]|uniref:Rap-GAP domain-containing protein n=1 Tax=Diabrotica balteata TaxID=107213 RepID=A0A9N9T9K3_DIABA|nr:unnamed protein product [Diabrotica balteata]